MKAALYVRVSTEEQATEGYSISAQTQRLKAYCVAQDWSISGIYIDEGISAKDMNRPKLQEMVKDIEKGKVDCVLVYRLDRLTRSVLDLYELLGIFEKYGCKFKSATEVYDTTTAMGRLFITIVAALAQWERENTGERIRMGLQEKVRQGKYAAIQRPIGYDLDYSTGELTINPKEAKTVKLIINKYLSGMGSNRVARYLNERNILTRNNNKWTDNTIMKVLKNPIYMGTIRWNKDKEEPLFVEDSVPPIIDKDTFLEIQKTIDRRRHMSPKQVSSCYIFSGPLKCKSCGRSLSGTKAKFKLATGEIKTYKSYRCLAVKKGLCEGSKNISELKLEKAFLQYIKDLDLPAQEVVAATKEEVVDFSEIKKELNEIEKRKKKWQFAWVQEYIDDEEFNARMTEERQNENRLREELEVPVKEETDHNEIVEMINQIEANWTSLEEEEKKNFVQMFVKRIEVSHDRHLISIDSIDFY